MPWKHIDKNLGLRMIPFLSFDEISCDRELVQEQILMLDRHSLVLRSLKIQRIGPRAHIKKEKMTGKMP